MHLIRTRREREKKENERMYTMMMMILTMYKEERKIYTGNECFFLVGHSMKKGTKW
jgi:hypothetical protein